MRCSLHCLQLDRPHSRGCWHLGIICLAFKIINYMRISLTLIVYSVVCIALLQVWLLSQKLKSILLKGKSSPESP